MDELNPADWTVLYQNAVDEEHDLIADEIKNIKYRYENVRFVAKGGSKEIYEVIDHMTERHVALAHPIDGSTEKQIEKFFQEGRLHSTLEHPNIIPVYDYGYRDEKPFFTMKLIGGSNLRDYLHHNEELSLDERLNIFTKVCDAISYCHSIGVIHCDLKPDNICISSYGEVLVVDWGLAKYLENSDDEDSAPSPSQGYYATMDGVIKGTPGYMSPEQARAENSLRDERSDIYSLGTIFYEILTFKAPFYGSIEEVLIKTVKGEFKKPIEQNSKIPTSLQAICLKAMALKKEHRYQNVSDLLADLDAFRNNYTPSAESSGPIREIQLFYRRNKKSVFISLIAAFLLVFITVFFINSLQQKNEEAQSARLKAEESERKLREEQQESNSLMKRLIPKQVEDLKAAILKHDYNYVQDLIHRILLLEPTHHDAFFYKALTHIARAEFDEAIEILKNYDDRYVKECRRYKNDESLLPNFLHRGSFWNRNPKFEIEHALLLQVYLNRNDLSTEEKLTCLAKNLTRDNPNDTQFRWNFKNGLHFDLSKNNGLWDIRALKNFELDSLNLSQTIVNDLWQLQGARIKMLNLSQTLVIDLYPLLTMPDLVEVDISYLNNTRNSHSIRRTEIRKIVATNRNTFNINNLPESIEQINAIDSKIMNGKRLLELPKLKSISVSKGALTIKDQLVAKGVEVKEVN